MRAPRRSARREACSPEPVAGRRGTASAAQRPGKQPPAALWCAPFEEVRMKRLWVAAALASSAASAQQQDFSKVEIKATKVAGSVWMLEGSGGNIGVSSGDDGIVMVDDQF